MSVVYKVTLEPSGHTFEVPEGMGILNAGLKAKMSMPYSCKTGVCRTCRGVIKEGRVDYGMVHSNYLSEVDKANGYALLCQAKPLSDVVVEIRELDGLAGVEPRMMPGRVVTMTRVASDVMVLQLRLHPNENMRYLAGQYINVQLPDGDTRSYSIASMPTAESARLITLHIRHLPGGKYTDHVFSTMKERELLRFEGPLGTFYVREDSDKPIVMIAGGTGFAPIKAMCEYIFDRGIQARRPVTLYWGCRSRRDLYMPDLPHRWAEEIKGFFFHPVLSDPTPDCRWSGRTGFVHEAVLEDYPDLSGVQVYASGSPAMVEAARRGFIGDRGLPDDDFFADAFLTAVEKGIGEVTKAD